MNHPASDAAATRVGVSRRRKAGPRRVLWLLWPGLLWLGLLWLGMSLAGSARALAALPDAGAPPADAGTLPAYAQDFRHRARHIRDFLSGRLDAAIDPQSLFDVPVDASDEEMRVERERIELLLHRAEASATQAAPGADEPPAAPSPQPEPTQAPEPGGWHARLALDRARLAFYGLPAPRRAELVRQHQAPDEPARSVEHDEALNHVQADARRAEQQQREALEAARRSRTEAARLINEEYARLLSITREQAEFESRLIERRADLDARNEVVLGWRRQVAELTTPGELEEVSTSAVDDAYVNLRVTLRQARQRLAKALGSKGDGVERVPQAGADPLVDLPVDADRSVAVQQRATVTAKARELLSAEQALETEEAHQLMSEVETLNRLRLELLGSLSAEKRDSILGFGPVGWDQAVAEVWQVVLTARYHLHAAFDWLDAIRSGERRGRSAWLAFMLMLKWAFPIGLFVWWRPRADGVLERWLEARRQEARTRRDGNWFEVAYAERSVAFLRRVRHPLEWLLLVGLVTWLMPEEMKGLLEVRLSSRVLLWIFGGLFIVLSIDALASTDALRGSSSTAQLRLRSLRLVGRAIVAFGLPLSLTVLLVGRGTVYSWVFSTCWFAAIPILFVIVAWWRPYIFERFTRMRKPSGFESWVLGQRSPAPNLFASALSSVAAVAGGVYLFVLGAWRVVRNRVVTFELTRRLLAYLFRRDLSKKARANLAPAYEPLSLDAFRALGPEVTSGQLVRSAADAQVQAVVERIKAAGGGAIAIVGERGSGKTMLVERIIAHCPDSIRVTCGVDGLPGLRVQLNLALGLSPTTTLELAAKNLDGRTGDSALLIDDAQYLIRPMMGGLAEFDGVLSLFRQHSRNCTWVLAFDEAVWRFIERSRGTRPLFDEVIRLSEWSEDAIVRLITQRNETAGVVPDFSEIAVDLPANADDMDIREAVRRTEASYYRLLWDYASGNPAVALHFWRRSLGVGPTGKVLVRLFEAPDTALLEALPDSSAFVLRAIVQLGWASPQDIARVTSLPIAQVEDALRFGNQHGYFEIRAERYSVNWDWFRAVTRLLQRRHLSFSAT